MYRLWLQGLYGLYGPRCPLSQNRTINLISLPLVKLISQYKRLCTVDQRTFIVPLISECNILNGIAKLVMLHKKTCVLYHDYLVGLTVCIMKQRMDAKFIFWGYILVLKTNQRKSCEPSADSGQIIPLSCIESGYIIIVCAYRLFNDYMKLLQCEKSAY